MFAWSCLVLGWGLLQLVGGESSPIVMLIGLRFWLLYIWFAVAAAAAMNEADYRAAILAAALVMILLAPLAVLQHYSPPGARINTQVDGDEESVFVAVVGVVRTTGTFSFTSGYATYMAMVAPLVFGILGARKRTSRQLLFRDRGLRGFRHRRAGERFQNGRDLLGHDAGGLPGRQAVFLESAQQGGLRHSPSWSSCWIAGLFAYVFRGASA